jgi:hypothetical protein
MSGGRFMLRTPSGGGGGLAISGTSGTLDHDQAVTITGSGFGTKAVAAPLVWEDMADGVLDELVTRDGSVVFNTNNLRHAHSTKNARSNYKVIGEGYYFGYDNGDAPKWFVQYWIKLASNWHFGTTAYPDESDDGLANVKIFRLFPIGGRTYTNVYYAVAGYDGQFYRIVENDTLDTGDIRGEDFESWFAVNVWHLVQVQYGENSGVDQLNGSIKLWIDGVLRDEMLTLNTNASDDGEAIDKRPYAIGFYDSWKPSDAAVANMYAYYGDIYVDDSWCRVELGNASTYAACTVREIQIPTSWATGSIGVTFKTNTFGTGASAWLYVVDATGAISAGFAVTLA